MNNLISTHAYKAINSTTSTYKALI